MLGSRAPALLHRGSKSGRSSSSGTSASASYDDDDGDEDDDDEDVGVDNGKGTSTSSSSSRRDARYLEFDVATCTESTPYPCLYSFEAEVGSKVISPKGSGQWISVKTLVR